MSSSTLNYSESCGKDDSTENMENCHIFHLNVISQCEGSTNYSNQLPLQQHVAEYNAEHLTMSCVSSHILCSFGSFCWTVHLNKLIKCTGTRAQYYIKAD